MTDKFELSRRKALGGLATIGVAGATAGYGTSALFSDTEEFANNTIQAGTADLSVELTLVDASNPDLMGLTVGSTEGDVVTADGSVRVGVQMDDIKPGDYFLLCWNVTVTGNPMYVAAQAANADDGEGANPEPEPQPGPDDGTDPIGDGQGDDAGDIDNVANVTFGYDDPANNNTWDGTDPANVSDASDLADDITAERSFANLTAFLDTLEDGLIYRGRNPDSGSPPAGHGDSSADPTRIGEPESASNVDADQVTHYTLIEIPASVGNEIQGDTLSFDLVWDAEQVRNNTNPFGNN